MDLIREQPAYAVGRAPCELLAGRGNDGAAYAQKLPENEVDDQTCDPQGFDR